MLCLLRRLWVTCMMLCITFFCVHAQHVVTGTVKDVAGEPVIGANILVKGTTNNGTITDIDGNFLWKHRPEESWKFLLSVM